MARTAGLSDLCKVILEIIVKALTGIQFHDSHFCAKPPSNCFFVQKTAYLALKNVKT